MVLFDLATARRLFLRSKAHTARMPQHKGDK